MKFPIRSALLNESTHSIPAGGGTATVEVPSGQAWEIKAIDVVVSANGTITSISVDGTDIKMTGANNDLEAKFGDLVRAQRSIVFTFDNAGAGAEDQTVTITGLAMG